MADPEGFADWIGRGARVAQEDARRIVRELLARGDISEAEASQIEAGVAEAVQRGLRFVHDRVTGPLQSVAAGVLSGARGRPDERGDPGARSDEILARLDALDARLARLEQHLDARTHPRSDDPGND